LYAPKKPPQPVLTTLNHALQESLKDADLKTNFAKLGTEPVPQNRATPQALQTSLKSEIDKWGPIIKKAGQYAD